MTGDDMAPVLPHGSIVGVNTDHRDVGGGDGRIVCARTPDDGVVIRRQIGRGNIVTLVSESANRLKYPPIPIDCREQPDWLIGQVTRAWVDLT